MLALAQYRSHVHEACGHYLPDVIGEAAEDAYVAGLPIRCHACTARLRAQTNHTEGPHEPHPDALIWPVLRR